MDNIKSTLNSIILNPDYARVLALIKAARNGAVYGAKVRFPHALVMVFLFRNGSLREKLFLIFKATRQHARNLALFAFLYKLMLVGFTYSPRNRPSTAKEASYDTFLAGLVAGYVVFGRGIQSSVNQQIVIYVFGRVVLALAKLIVQRESLVAPDTRHRLETYAWPAFASFSWAAVMWLFRWHPDTLQPSLRSSMKYIYQNSDYWHDIRTFLIHNS